MNRPDHEIDAYLDGQPTPQQLRTLEAWIQADPAHAASFLSAVQMHHQVGQRLMKARLSEKLAEAKPQQAASSESSIFAAEVLEALQQLEQDSADAELQHLPPVGRARLGRAAEGRPADTAPPVTASDLAGISGYLLRKLVTSRPVIFAAAAAVALGVCVLLILQAGHTPTDPASPTTTQTPGENSPATAVATLTATYNAAWSADSAEGAAAPVPPLTPGSSLHPGDRLTLTHGFAEITTRDGALAILEAPATIELLDNNAIRLHQGKLVGVCETDSSKGFVVKTPGLAITDLGTRFGVAVKDNGSTLAEVFEGKVSLSSGDLTTDAVALTAGQSFATDHSGMVLEPSTFEPGQFAGLLNLHDSQPVLAGGVDLVSADRFIGKNFDDWPTRSRAMIFREPVRMRLASDLPVSNRGAGRLAVHLFGATLQDPPVIAAGSTIRSYVLALNPQRRQGVTDVRGSVTFQGEVLGVIYTDAQWQGFLRAARAAGQLPFDMDENHFIESVHFGGQDRPAISDQLTVSEDRRTLHFRIYSKGFCDVVRVIVRGPDERLLD